MKKITYINMGVKISVSTSTMQPPAPKISEVHFNIFDLKNKKMVQFPLYFLKFPLYFQCVFPGHKKGNFEQSMLSNFVYWYPKEPKKH